MYILLYANTPNHGFANTPTSGLIYLIPRRGFAQSKHSDGGSGSQGRGAGSNTGAEKLFYQKSCFSWVFPMKIKKYFGHKLIKNPSKINFSTIFWKLLSGSIRMTHPLFTIFIKKYKKTAFYSNLTQKTRKNIKIWRISPLRGLCWCWPHWLKKWKKILPEYLIFI